MEGGPLEHSSGAPDLPLYQTVAARRLQWDALLWQVPTVSLTAQAFLLTIVANGGANHQVRVAAAALGAFAAFNSWLLMGRHRRAELCDAHWLARYEQAHFGRTVHGPKWAVARNQTQDTTDLRWKRPLLWAAHLPGNMGAFLWWVLLQVAFLSVDVGALVMLMLRW